ncbi:MAG: LPD1 domain-containing protein [Pseudomonadota bacterium]
MTTPLPPIPQDVMAQGPAVPDDVFAEYGGWREDLRAGLLAAQQGVTALTTVAPAAGALAFPNSDEAAYVARTQELADAGLLPSAARPRGAPINPRFATPELAQRELAAGAARIGELDTQMQDYPVDPRAGEVFQADTFASGLMAFLENPGTATRVALLRSLPAMAPTVAAAGAGQLAGGPIGAAAAGGATGATTEYAMSLAQGFSDYMRANNIDPQDEQAVASMFAQNPEAFDAIVRDAAIRAGVIGAADAAGAGIAGRIASAAQDLPRAARVASVPTVSGVEAVGEGAGEAGAQLATEGEIRPGEVIAEAVAGGAMGAPQAALQLGAEAVRRDQPSGPLPPVPQDVNSQVEDQPVQDSNPLLLSPLDRVDTQENPQASPQEVAPQPVPSADPTAVPPVVIEQGQALLDNLPDEGAPLVDVLDAIPGPTGQPLSSTPDVAQTVLDAALQTGRFEIDQSDPAQPVIRRRQNFSAPTDNLLVDNTDSFAQISSRPDQPSLTVPPAESDIYPRLLPPVETRSPDIGRPSAQDLEAGVPQPETELGAGAATSSFEDPGTGPTPPVPGLPDRAEPLQSPTQAVSSPALTPGEAGQPVARSGPASPGTFQEQSRLPRGTGLTPSTRSVSYTEKPAIYEQAWRDAGHSPDEATVKKPGEKIRILQGLFRDRFGLEVSTGSGANRPRAIDATDQMLDGYRNVQFMLNALGLPPQALGLNNTLRLSLERDRGRYLGVYRPDKKAIGLPGRSNSFAHEWMHALDDYMADTLKKAPELLSQLTRREGLDPTQNLEAAFIDLVNTMFFDDAALASRMLLLEKDAQSTDAQGQPTKKARTALAQLDRLRAGNTRLRIDPTAYRRNSADYAPASGYWASVHEMMARAFEAYIAHRVALNGGTNEFITKGDEAYLSDADRRLQMTFPRAVERANIFRAFDNVFGQIGAAHMFGYDPKTQRPPDVDIMDPGHWSRLALSEPQVTFFERMGDEFRWIGNGLRNALTRPITSLKNTVSLAALNAGILSRPGAGVSDMARRAGRRVADIARHYTFSLRAVAKTIVSRQPADAQIALQMLMDRVMTDPGTDRNVGETFEEFRERKTNEVATQVVNMLKTNRLTNRITGNVSDPDTAAIREILLSGTAPGATKEQTSVAAGLRRIYNSIYRTLSDAGVNVGFVENTGYVPRVINFEAVNDNRETFVKQAVEVYKEVFDSTTAAMDVDDLIAFAHGVALQAEPMQRPSNGRFGGRIKALRQARGTSRAGTARGDLLSALRDTYAEQAAAAWMERIVQGDSLSFDTLGPAAQYTKKRELPPSADTLMAEFYETDVILGTIQYAHNAFGRAAYQSRLGLPGGTHRLDNLLRRQSIQDAIAAQPAKYATGTPAGRANILRDLADPHKDDLKEIALNEAVKNGAKGDDIRVLRRQVELITGRDPAQGHPVAERVSAGLYTLGLITLLPRAAWTSLAEPLTIAFRTRDGRAIFRQMGFYMREAVRSAKSVRELSEIANMVGVVSTPLHDVVMMNRVSGDFGAVVSGQTLLTRYFRTNFLSQLTNAQRRSSLAAGSFWLRDIARDLQSTTLSDARRKILEAELNELGVPQGQDRDRFLNWLVNLDNGVPSIDELQTPEGQVFSGVIGRFVDQVIQNPRRADKVTAASSPMGRLVYALMSFSYTFFRNVHLAMANRTARNYRLAREAGEGKLKAGARAAGVPATFAAGFTGLLAGQMMVSALREAIYNRDMWDEKGEDDERGAWIFQLALSRTGIWGPADAVQNALTGLRYERDLGSLFIGAYPAFVASSIQNMINGLPQGELYPGGPGVGLRNSPNTNAAEHTAARSIYRLFVAPLANVAFTAAPSGGPLGDAARFVGMQYFSSSSMAHNFADSLVGERD